MHVKFIPEKSCKICFVQPTSSFYLHLCLYALYELIRVIISDYIFLFKIKLHAFSDEVVLSRTGPLRKVFIPCVREWGFVYFFKDL